MFWEPLGAKGLNRACRVLGSQRTPSSLQEFEGGAWSAQNHFYSKPFLTVFLSPMGARLYIPAIESCDCKTGFEAVITLNYPEVDAIDKLINISVLLEEFQKPDTNKSISKDLKLNN